MKRRQFLAASLVGLCAPALGLRAQSLTPIKLALGPAVDVSALTLTLGRGLGYYAEEGLDVDVVALGSVPVVTTAIDRGDVQFGVGTTTFQFPLFEKGQLPPVVNFFEYVYPFRWDIAVSPGSPIRSYHDLKGKTIGVASMGTTDYPMMRKVLSNIGIDPDNDVTWQPVGAGVLGGVALRDGAIDAMATYEIVLGMIEGNEIPFVTLPRPESVPMIGGVFYSARATFLKENRATAVGIARATRKSSEFVIANPRAAADVFLTMYPEFIDRTSSREVAIGRILPSIKRRAKLLLPPFPKTRPGEIAQVEIQASKEFDGITADVNSLFTSDLIDEINEFDVAAIHEQAKSYSFG